MMPYSHFFSAVIAIHFFLQSIDPQLLLLFLIATIAPDLDFIPAYLLDINHRVLPPHWFSTWLATALIGILFALPGLVIFSAGCLLHLLLDLVDWGIEPFLPFFRLEFKGLLTVNVDNDGYKGFFKTYYRSKPVMIIDMFLLLAGTFTITLAIL